MPLIGKRADCGMPKGNILTSKYKFKFGLIPEILRILKLDSDLLKSCSIMYYLMYYYLNVSCSFSLMPKFGLGGFIIAQMLEN